MGRASVPQRELAGFLAGMSVIVAILCVVLFVLLSL
jgi:hypothetical protein